MYFDLVFSVLLRDLMPYGDAGSAFVELLACESGGIDDEDGVFVIGWGMRSRSTSFIIISSDGGTEVEPVCECVSLRDLGSGCS